MGKKHPLEIFRTNPVGFAGASAANERRTVTGKVVGSTPRRAEGAAATAADSEAVATDGRLTGSLPPAIAAARAAAERRAALSATPSATPSAASAAAAAAAAARRPLIPPVLRPAPEPSESARSAAGSAQTAARPAPARPARGHVEEARPVTSKASVPGAVNRVLLAAALLLVAALTVWVAGVNFGGGDTTLSLKHDVPAQAAPAAPTAAAQPANIDYRIVAAGFAGTPVGQSQAFAARDVLRSAGYLDARVLGYGGAEPGTYERFELHVGSANSADELAELLQAVRQEEGWTGGDGLRPFRQARLMGFPRG